MRRSPRLRARWVSSRRRRLGSTFCATRPPPGCDARASPRRRSSRCAADLQSLSDFSEGRDCLSAPRIGSVAKLMLDAASTRRRTRFASSSRSRSSRSASPARPRKAGGSRRSSVLGRGSACGRTSRGPRGQLGTRCRPRPRLCGLPSPAGRDVRDHQAVIFSAFEDNIDPGRALGCRAGRWDQAPPAVLGRG